MTGEKAGNLLWQIRMVLAAEHTQRLTDRELLERFVNLHDEAAFAALVQRHGAMVLRVCRGVLGQEQDAEDAFQAVFLVLARKAATSNWQESIGSWLYEVARRLAQEAKGKVQKRRGREGRAGPRLAADPLAEITGRELIEALDEELLKLSDPHRGPLVLCCLEGKSGDEAARQLGCSPSTLKRRLSRARQLLQNRLKRRGIALPAAAVSTLLLHGGASGTLPPALNQSTAQAAMLYAAGGKTAGAVSAKAVALSEAVLKGLFLTKLLTRWKLGAALLALACAVGGAGLWAHQALAAREASDRSEDDSPVVTLAESAARELARRPATTQVKEQAFDRDPGWESFNNRIVPRRIPTVTQGFGYSPTHFAGKNKGEIGGLVTRSTTPAYYADPIAVKTLNDRLTAAGTFALTTTSGNSAVFFGWFNAAQPGGGRPRNSLGLYLEGEKDRDGKGARLAVRLVAGTNRTCEACVTPDIGPQRPTPIRTDGTRYTWTLDYDPAASGGNGRFQFIIQGDRGTPEDWEGRPFTVDLPAGFKQEGASFDRFGLMNLMKPGNAMTIWFDDLRYDGKAEDFAADRGWEGSGNHATFPDPVQPGSHDFGFSATTSFAGGAPGEIGGTFWRVGTGYGYYADRIGPLTLADRLEARGRVVLKVGAPESDMYLGWFSSAARDRPPTEAGHFLGIHLGGPTRVGHYFRPACSTARGTRSEPNQGPVLLPEKAYEWTLIYDPTASDGQGAMQLTLGSESVTLTLRKGRKAEGACFDRFGLFTSAPGGSLVKVYFDDLAYTHAAGPRYATNP
jgi:RNA polymerase sigma factor (sigma-70 family)